MSDLYDKGEFDRVANYLFDVVVPLMREVGLDRGAKDVWMAAFALRSKHLEYYVKNPLKVETYSPVEGKDQC